MNKDQLQSKVRQTLLVKLLPEPMQERFIEILSSVSEEKQAETGATLFKIGDTSSDQGCLIIEGMLKVTRGDGEVRYIEAPDIAGEVQLFKPQGERTATVDVVIGGPMLTFAWQAMAAAAKEAFSDEEMAALRKSILHIASSREPAILQRGKDGPDAAST